MKIRFDEKEHRYFIGKREVLSVSKVLELAGIIDKRFISEWHLDRGVKLHQALEYLDLGALDLGSVDERILPHVQAYQKFLSDTGAKIIAIEQIVYSKLFDYCGRLDRIMTLNGRNIIVDLKTNSDPPHSGMQLSAYAQAAEESGLKTYGIYVLKLKANDTYKLIKKENKLTDFLGHLRRIEHDNRDCA